MNVDNQSKEMNRFLAFILGFIKCIAWAVLIILIIIALFLVYYVILSKKAAKEGLQYKPPMALYTIISPSMQPNINIYDVVFSVKTEPEELKKGDVITFYTPDEDLNGIIITHRILEIEKSNDKYNFKTKGDNNIEADKTMIPEENIIGKVVLKIPQLGRVQFLLSSKKGWFIAILIPAITVIVIDIVKLCRLIALKHNINKNNKQKNIIDDNNNINNDNNNNNPNNNNNIT